MSDPWGKIPNLSGQRASSLEGSRVGDTNRFFAPADATGIDPTTGRILNVPRAEVFRNGGTVPASGTPYLVAWDSIEYNIGGMWSSKTPERLTAHVAGLYQVWGWGQWAASAAVTRRMLLTKTFRSGLTKVYWNPGGEIPAVGAGLGTMQAVNFPVDLEPGEYVTLTVTQFSGAPLSFDGATVALRTNGFAACLMSTHGSDNQ